jgi:peptidoglycan/xylan/chitin deacetylase (PgdA/CDA1 family)
MNFTALLAFVAALLSSQAYAGVIDRCNAAGMMALTFDDGPASYTGQLLDILKSKNVRATFHLTTKHLTDPAVQSSIQAISSAGHLIGLRTEADWDLLKMSDDQIRSSIARQANVMASFIGYYPKFVRLPYGGYDDRVLRAVESTGAVVTTHNLETYDYTNDGNRVVNAVQLATSLLAPGAGSFIVVQHDGVQQSVAVSGKVIDIAAGATYKLVTLDACLGMGDMTKNKVALKGGSGAAGGVLPMNNSGKGVSAVGGSSSGSVGGSAGDFGMPAGGALGGQKANAASFGAKASGFLLATAALACAALAL